MKLESLKEGVGSLWSHLAEGWHHLTRTAVSALTRFKPGESTQLPSRAEVDDASYPHAYGWAVLGGEIFEDEARLIVRLELPGMDKQDVAVEVRDDALIVSGEKRFEREQTEGRWRVMQRAYGSFNRVVALPVPVQADKASATYRDGVLRVELPKVAPGKPSGVAIHVE